MLETALAVADEHGLAAVTMHAVAERLGVTPMALYRHVANKADLLDGLVERLLGAFPVPPPGAPWPDRLVAMSDGVRATARAHPDVFPLLLQRPASTPAARQVRDRVYVARRDAGVPEALVARSERLPSTVILGFAVSEAAGRFRDHTRAELDEDFAQLQAMLARELAAQVTSIQPTEVAGSAGQTRAARRARR